MVRLGLVETDTSGVGEHVGAEDSKVVGVLTEGRDVVVLGIAEVASLLFLAARLLARMQWAFLLDLGAIIESY